MMLYDIWMEGYAMNGGNGTATLFSIVEADSFQEACDKNFKNDSLYIPGHLSYWGCGLFDNEKDARKNFG